MASNGRRNARENSKAGFEKRQKRRQIRALQEAIDKQDITAVKEILEDDFDVDFQYRGQTALQLAVREGHFDICKLLIEKGANVDMADAERNNLLNMACWRGYTDIAELLVNNNATIDDQNIHGFSPINTCASRGHPDILQILLSAKGDPNIPNQHGESALHTATRLQNSEIMQLLLLGGCNVDRTDENRRTALSVAAESGFTEIVKILIAGGSKVNSQDRTGSSPLFHAVRNGHVHVIEELIRSGADVNLATTKGISPLLESIHNSNMDIALLLIDLHCDVNQTDRMKQAPIHAAVRKVIHNFLESPEEAEACAFSDDNNAGDNVNTARETFEYVSQYFSEEMEKGMTLIRRLVEAGCDLNVADQQGERPLYQSACGGNFELTQYLLDKKVEVSGKTNMGDTILHGGVHGNQPEVVDLLINSGSRLDEQNNAGEHALLTAILYRADFKIVQSLVKAGSNLNVRDKAHQNTALHSAILHYYREAADLLIKSGCDLNTLNGKRHTPLYVACEKNDDITARQILQSENFNRKTLQVRAVPQPMFAAVTNGHVHLVQALIEANFNINMVNTDGFSPVLLGIKENCPYVVKLLLKYNADLEAHAKTNRLMKCCLLHEDGHPHFDLEPLFLALSHKDLDLMDLIVKCYYKIPVEVISMLDRVFNSTPDLMGHYSSEQQAQVADFFRRCRDQPRMLQEICRASVREMIGIRPAEKVSQLPLANKLKEYVLMEELFGTLEDDIRESEANHPTSFHDFQSVPDSD